MNMHDVAGSASLEKIGKEKLEKLRGKSCNGLRADVFFKEENTSSDGNWKNLQYYDWSLPGPTIVWPKASHDNFEKFHRGVCEAT